MSHQWHLPIGAREGEVRLTRDALAIVALEECLHALRLIEPRQAFILPGVATLIRPDLHRKPHVPRFVHLHGVE